MIFFHCDRIVIDCKNIFSSRLFSEDIKTVLHSIKRTSLPLKVEKERRPTFLKKFYFEKRLNATVTAPITTRITPVMRLSVFALALFAIFAAI